MHFRHITISGEPGSGKSSVGRELARIYGMDIVSTGALQRELAVRWAYQLWMSTRELNLISRLIRV
ncbi:(d)CMP kinase [Rhodococcus oxybenzonivorans]|uniref:(d)CMP kinase n=1 Tax=Rhodococcus oxybenzonivorans TaxID=1990687 RepID=UPI000D69EF7D